MSQNTRCPSCATLFKVVADQLRISDGWVRCGQCQQIFDATAHLQQAPESALLPDLGLELPLDSGRVPPEAPGAETARRAPSADNFSVFSDLPLADETAPPASPVPSVAPVLEVPESVVPAFLIAPAAPQAPAPDGPPPFAWHNGPTPALAEQLVIPVAPVGYELPSAPLPDADFEWLEEYEALNPEPEPHFSTSLEDAPSDLPWMQAPAAPPAQPPQPAVPTPSASPTPDDSADDRQEPAAESQDTPEWVENLVLPSDPPRSESVLHVDVDTEPDLDPESETEADVPSSDSPLEPSFVLAARRQAFWRQLEVRVSLALLSLLLVAVLVFQVALHQRNYLAAAYPQWRSLLQTLCVPLQCKVGPYRHISSIVIDSSSFNKVQGETYQFALALKNISDNVLEIPAIELTLTDAQDQTVLRRVFTRKDLSAPRTLAAHGDWSATLQVQLTLDGALIAGYRVLAFYP